jgi:hypothetical protein
MPYAEGTSVSPERSQMEIAGLIRKYGAGSFATGWMRDNAIVTFVAHDRQIKFVLAMPTDWREFEYTDKKVRRKEPAARAAMEAEVRRRWRSLANAIRSKLDVVETGISTFETEFLPHTVMPDGRTIAEHIGPKIEEAIATGRMPDQLLAIGGAVDA